MSTFNTPRFTTLLVAFVVGVVTSGCDAYDAAMSKANAEVDKQANVEMQRISDQVARDAVTQYQMARRSGTAMDVCVQAMSVSAAYLQAKDELHYAAAKKAEMSDCKRAGMPQ